MIPNWPNTLDTYPIMGSGVYDRYTIETWHVTNLYDIISGIESGIGLSPLNGYDSLTARISGIELCNPCNKVDKGGDIMSGTLWMQNTNIVISGYLNQGSGNSVYGAYATVFGINTIAGGDNSFAEGDTCIASGIGSHAEGQNSEVYSNYSHVEGQGFITSGANFSHAEGQGIVHGIPGGGPCASHAEGGGTTMGIQAHAEGNGTLASGNFSHAEGVNTQAFGIHSHSEGTLAFAGGNSSHAQGANTKAIGDYSFAGGNFSFANGNYSFAFGNYGQTSSAPGTCIFTDSQSIITTNNIGDSFWFRFKSGVYLASGTNILTTDSGINNIGSPEKPFNMIYANNVSFGNSGGWVLKAGDTVTGNLKIQNSSNLIIDNNTTIINNNLGTNIVVGTNNTLGGGAQYGTTIGDSNFNSGYTSIAIGQMNVAVGDSSSAIGFQNTSLANYSVAIGLGNVTNTVGSIALGEYNTTNGIGSIALGQSNITNGTASVVAGSNSMASGMNSVAIGNQAIATQQGSWCFTDSQALNTYNDISDSLLMRFQNGIILNSDTSLMTNGSGVSFIGTSNNPFGSIYAKDGYFTNLHGLSPITINNDLIAANSGIQNLGSSSKPFNVLYANSVIASGITNWAFNEVPAGTVNGLNTTFTLAHSPKNNSLQMYVAGLRIHPTLFSVANSTITLTVAPATLSLLVADYQF